MQFIPKKEEAPTDWNKWFTKASGGRSHDYKKDYSELTQLHHAKAYLLEEQHHLCAYCQRELEMDTASIEHVTPKSKNKALSTNYHNLVVVCKTPFKDPQGKQHCDKERGNGDALLPPLIFYNNTFVSERKSHAYFTAHADGTLSAKRNLPPSIVSQIKAFIDLLNLNNYTLKDKRKDTLNAITALAKQIPKLQLKAFWQSQFNYYLHNLDLPYRQFVLIYLAQKLGVN